MHRVIMISSVTTGIPAIMARALHRAIATRPDFELCAICLPWDRPPNRVTLLARLWMMLDPYSRGRTRLPTLNLSRWQRVHGIPVFSPASGDFNDQTFIDRIVEHCRPTIGLSVYCYQKLRPNFLTAMPQLVNYHNGAVPGYRGMGVTGWAIYNRETYSSYTFHHVTEGLDEGNVLFAGREPLNENSTANAVEMSKARAAGKRLPELLELMAREDPGQPQKGITHYYSRKDYLDLITIADPAMITAEDLKLRLRAFGHLRLQLGGNWYNATALRQIGNDRKGPLVFRTADGIAMTPARIGLLPPLLYRIRSWLRRKPTDEG